MRQALILSAIALAGLLGAQSVEIDPAKLRMFKPLPDVAASGTNPVTDGKVALGRLLYYEPRLSKAHDISCNTCHPLDRYGAEPEAVSTGHKGLKGSRNAPTVYNAAGHVAQFWDGRAPDVEEQAKGPVMNPVEMAMASENAVRAVLRSMPEYVTAFRKAFPEDRDPVTFENMARAIGAFERKLLTPSRWDKFLRGDRNALSADEKAGFNQFVDLGCHTCHSGPYLGGAMFQKLGLRKAWPDTGDLGRYHLTKSDGDKWVFKVPSLRNIEKTAPYFHDGSARTLEESIASMADFQLGRKLAAKEVSSIVAWLRSLTGEIPVELIQPPALPKSTSRTPKPSTD